MQAINEEKRLESLESEIIALRKSLDIVKKDPRVWQKLDELGKSISKSWASSEPSWELISESRR